MRYMTRPLLLLDVDGVLLRDKALHMHLERNVHTYVAKKLPKARDPVRVARMLYSKYGHTGKGLMHAFQIDTSDFNKSIYTKDLMSHLWSVISGPEFQSDAAEIHELSHRWDIHLFSNAPMTWTFPVASAIGDSVRIPRTNFYLKPDPRAYMKFPQQRRKVFVDDTIQNLRTARYFETWTPVLFCETEKNHEFVTVGSIWELCLFLNSSESF